jgi:hypothetical protein
MADRFPPAVVEALTAAGWQPGRRVPEPTAKAIAAVSEVVSALGRRHTVVEPAVAALTEFGGLWIDQEGPGRDQLRRPFGLDPTVVAASVDTLTEVGRVLGLWLFPIGSEGAQDSILAMDEHGRVFAIDQAGEWFVGGSIDEALVALIEGHRLPLVDERGTW